MRRRRPSVWLEPVRSRNGATTSYRIRWRDNGLLNAENTGPNKADALRRQAEIRDQLWGGRLRYRRGAPPTWGALAERFSRDCRPNLATSTWRNHYSRVLRDLAALWGPDLLLDALAGERVAAYKAWLEAPPAAADRHRRRALAPNTVSMHLRCLRAVLNYAIKPLGWLRENPAEAVAIPAYRPTWRVLSDAELRRLMAKARGRVRPIIWIDAHCGMRNGELVNLQHPQLDRRGGYVRVMRHSRLGIRTAWERKTRNEVMVPIPARLWRWFPAGGGGWVFPGYHPSNPVERVVQVGKDVREAAAAAALGRVRLHDLKHTFCTRFLEAGGKPTTLAAITGTSLQTLQRTYVHLINRAVPADMRLVSFGSAPALPQQKPKKRRPRLPQGQAPSRKSQPMAGLGP